MAGRALVFSNPEIVRQLQTRFVPYAGDQWYLHRQKDSTGDFFWKVVQQGLNKDRPLDSTRQGIYAATPDGRLLGSINSWSAERTLAMLHQATEQAKALPPIIDLSLEEGAPDEQYRREPPEGGLILNTYSRIPLTLPDEEEYDLNRATGRDHLWITAREKNDLLPDEWVKGERFPVPPTLAERLLRYHLVDNVRGEPNMWRKDEIKESNLIVRVVDPTKGLLRMEGTARMQAPAQGDLPERGYNARLEGTLVYDRSRERFTRFDLLSWGEAWGEGTYTRNAPKGKFPLVIAFSLAGNKPADRIPPQGARDGREYLGTE